MEPARFSFKRYSFTEAHLSLTDIPNECGISLNFHPTGVFHCNTGIFSLTLDFTASYEKEQEKVNFAKIVLNADFEFKDITSLGEVPDYFYPNSLAIVFPYIRAFISTLTLQANVRPIVLPTMNLSSLKLEFRNNSTESTNV